MTSSVRSHSLLEQKKLQWAKEREEMLGLCGIWGSFARSYHDSDRSSIRSQYLSSIDLNHHVDTSPDASDASGEDRDSHSTSTMKFSLRRSPSLPPIFTPDKQSSCYGNEGDAEGEDETGDGEEGGTSGYASDSGGGNEYHVTQSWGGVLHRNSTSTNQWQPHNNFRRQTSPDSVTCGGSEMGRPRWGDKGVGVGHLWVPTTHNPDARLPQAPDPRPGPTPPAWLHRRLNKLGEPAQILVISHRDDASTRSKDFTGSCDSINSSECTKTTYLRGQNIPLEPEELAEREIKRRKALEHQNAIRQQLEERERKRKEEKEKRMQEERRAEERLKKQQEMERKRLDDEQRRQKEKEEKEERKAQAMREALESAERAAREDKIRERRRHAAERNANATSDLDESMRRVQLSEHEQLQHNDSSSCSGSEQQFLNPQQQNYNKMDSDCEQKPQQYANQQPYTNQQNQQFTNQQQYTIQQNQQFTNQQQYTNQQYTNQQQTHQLNNSNGGDAITVISDTRKLQNHVSDDERPIATIKAAAIVAPIAAPSPMAGNDNDQSEHESGEESSVSTSIGIVLSPQEISANQLSVIPSPGRLLTPSKFRTRQRAVEKATQTFLNKSERNQKLAQRYRGQQHSVARLEDRPKWGVNRPEMQYIKQSDRDPYRLRRVVNTRLRARNTSQETSRSPSPGKHSVLNSSNHSDASLNKSITSNSPSITGVSVSRGTTTPRLQVIQKVGSIRKSSAGRPRYISVKGAVMHSNHVRQRMLNRVQLQPPKMNLDANNVVNHEKTEIVSVRDVLNQLTSLRQGLSQKQHEWDISRCQTPYSEVSSRS